MSEETHDNPKSLIQTGSQAVSQRSSKLVQRGLATLNKREPRVVHFPKDWPLGTVYTADERTEIWEERQWVKVGKADGSVVVPPGKKLILDLGCLEDYGDEIRSCCGAELAENMVDYFLDKFWNIDVSPLASLKPFDLQGIKFGFYGCSPKDAKLLEQYTERLTGLEWLGLGECSSDFWFLKNLTNLRGLDMYEADLWSLAPIQNLTGLRYLDLSRTEIYDLEYLEDLINLEKLHLHETPIHDLCYLKGLSKLRLLDLRWTAYDEDSEEVKELKLALPNCEIWF